MPAAAEPIPLGYNTGNSFTQHWHIANPEVPWGTFDTIALEFVSQTNVPGGTTTQTEFKGVTINNAGWHYVTGTNLLAFGAGPLNGIVLPHITFHGEASEWVTWNIWYYRNGVALGGYQYQGLGLLTLYSFTDLTAGGAPLVLIPLPTGAAMGCVSLLGLCAWRVSRRRR
ncbi:MAG: hypothetical protein ACKVU4_03485 [Phycisphaerales bacterium]